MIDDRKKRLNGIKTQIGERQKEIKELTFTEGLVLKKIFIKSLFFISANKIK
jgi:DNA-directed RNA polymerase specialized sigma subunit